MVAVFAMYMALVFLFAAIYFALYRNDPNAFAFSGDILRTQSARVSTETNLELATIGTELAYLKQLQQHLRSDTTEPTRGTEHLSMWLTSSVRNTSTEFKVSWCKARASRSPQTPFTLLYVTDAARGTHVILTGKSHYSLPESRVDFIALADQWIADHCEREDQLREISSSLETESPLAWSYFDFIYFSAITQFTVGYGDILPNSQSVRMVVTIQTCVAAGLLVVVINLLGPKPALPDETAA